MVDELPLGSREEIADPVPLSGPWRLVSSVDGVRTWEAPSPVRPRTLFFHRPPDDMALLRRTSAEASWEEAETWKHKAGLERADQAGTWDFSTRALRVRRRAEVGPPAPHEYAVTYSNAVEREEALQRRTWRGRDLDFVQRSLQVDDTTRRGLLLPSPAAVSHALTVPEGGVLDLGLVLVPPEAADPARRSDGATLVVEVEVEGARTELLRAPARLAEHVEHELDLSAWGGQEAVLHLRSEPGETAALDYLFVTEPVVHGALEDPPRVALVFIDTLRPDHMSLYGAERPTTPRLDAWAESAAVFEEARSVAPWTLPSSRTMLLGAQPERWEVARGIHEALAEDGWATGFFAGNVYLSSNFSMSRGWGTHRCINWPLAQVQVDRALEWLEEREDQPAFVLLHLMDMHLPYTEPPRYRRLFAGDTPEVLGSDGFLRGDVTRARSKLGEEGRQHIRDRYDNNLRYVDDQLARFLAAFDEEDLVLIVSDHGEEFWDHGGFEHGHTLYDELLRVPLVARGPGLEAGRFDAPTSLLDLAPTIAVATGQSLEGMEGLPLQGVADGTLEATARARPLAFGRPLYGDRRWGSLSEGLKYHSSAGKEQIYDLGSDRAEDKDLRRRGADPAPLREALAAGLGRPAQLGYRLVSSGRAKDDVTVRLEVPGGVRWAYAAEDPTSRSTAEVSVQGEVVEVTWPASNRGSHEVFVAPEAEAVALLPELALSAPGEEAEPERLDPEEETPVMDGKGETLLRVRAGNTTVRLTFGVSPGPLEEGAAVAGYNPEVRAELQALGYVEEDEEDGGDGDEDGDGEGGDEDGADSSTSDETGGAPAAP